jgi:hypothetical protein
MNQSATELHNLPPKTSLSNLDADMKMYPLQE